MPRQSGLHRFKSFRDAGVDFGSLILRGIRHGPEARRGSGSFSSGHEKPLSRRERGWGEGIESVPTFNSSTTLGGIGEALKWEHMRKIVNRYRGMTRGLPNNNHC